MEFWITPDGVIYCDGDAGVDVPNHEAVVRQQCLSNLIDAMETSGNSQIVSLASEVQMALEDVVDLPMLREQLNLWVDNAYSEGQIDEKAADDIYDFIRARVDMPYWEFETALGMNDHIDERNNAIKLWGWHRVQHNNLTVAKLTRKLLSELADGLHECFGEDVYSMKFNIETVEYGHMGLHCNVPYQAIDSGDLGFIRSNSAAGSGV